MAEKKTFRLKGILVYRTKTGYTARIGGKLKRFTSFLDLRDAINLYEKRQYYKDKPRSLK